MVIMIDVCLNECPGGDATLHGSWPITMNSAMKVNVAQKRQLHSRRYFRGCTGMVKIH